MSVAESMRAIVHLICKEVEMPIFGHTYGGHYCQERIRRRASPSIQAVFLKANLIPLNLESWGSSVNSSIALKHSPRFAVATLPLSSQVFPPPSTSVVPERALSSPQPVEALL